MVKEQISRRLFFCQSSNCYNNNNICELSYSYHCARVRRSPDSPMSHSGPITEAAVSSLQQSKPQSRICLIECIVSQLELLPSKFISFSRDTSLVYIAPVVRCLSSHLISSYSISLHSTSPSNLAKMKLILSSLLLPLLAAAAPARVPDKFPFTVLASRPHSPIHFLPMTADGLGLYLGGKTYSYCPKIPNLKCPPAGGQQTVFAPSGYAMVCLLSYLYLLLCNAMLTLHHRTTKSPAASRFTSARTAPYDTRRRTRRTFPRAPRSGPSTTSTSQVIPSATTPIRAGMPTVSWPARPRTIAGGSLLTFATRLSPPATSTTA